MHGPRSLHPSTPCDPRPDPIEDFGGGTSFEGAGVWGIKVDGAGDAAREYNARHGAGAGAGEDNGAMNEFGNPADPILPVPMMLCIVLSCVWGLRSLLDCTNRAPRQVKKILKILLRGTQCQSCIYYLFLRKNINLSLLRIKSITTPWHTGYVLIFPNKNFWFIRKTSISKNNKT